MKALFKKYWPIVLLLFVCGGVLSIGYNFLSDLLYSKALAAAKAEYDQKIADANARIKVNTEHYSAIIGKAERDRQDAKAQHEAEIRKYKNDIGYFKSETADALKAKEATVAQWYAAKQLDEVTIGLASDRIEAQDATIEKMITEHGQAIADLNTAHQAIVDDLVLKFQSCQQWSSILEKRLARPKFWTYIKDAAVIGGSFLLGRASK